MSLDFLFETAEFKRLVQALRLGQKGLSLSGVSDPAKPYLLACMAQKTARTIVVIRPISASLTDFADKCRFFLEQLAGRGDVAVLPALAADPYEDIPPSLDAIASRMRFFYELRTRTPPLVVTNLPGLLKPFPGPESLDGFFLRLEKGQPFERDALLRFLSEYGYAREELVASHGEYAGRGGIVDVFSPWEALPFRVEFSGEDVVSIRTFDPSSQRSAERRDRAVLPSLREFPGSPDFIRACLEGARRAAGAAHEDVSAKQALLERGEVYPAFHFESLIRAERFAPFDRFLSEALFVVDDYDEVESEWGEARAEFDREFQALRSERKYGLSPEEIFPGEGWRKIQGEAVLFRTLVSPGAGSVFAFPFQSVPRFDNKIPFFLQYLKKAQRSADRCFIYLGNEGLAQKFSVLFDQNRIAHVRLSSALAAPPDEAIGLLVGPLERGFSFSEEKIHFFGEKDILTEERVVTSRLAAARPFLTHFQDLKAGDHVLHTDYGIGLFAGLLKMDVDNKAREFIELHYRDEDRLYVPVEDLNLVQKFTPVGPTLPPLDKLGTQSWEKTKDKAKKAVQKLAKELLELYAQRKTLSGFGFSPSGPWKTEFETTFEYEETEDQLRSFREIEKDMESPLPMDRLLCGDVGYGKTEVAMRAAFKAVMDGKQVAVLCPTTVLASQHLQTFRHRMALFPVRVEALTRLQPQAEQRRIIVELKKGAVDIILGTHRLLSRDVAFRDLGLLVVDEEQRFGVNHKEKIKQLKADIDVLTLTATPIPRTLNLSLAGLRDISLIETPPRDRLAVHTVVTTYSLKLIAAAVRQELKRGGQVYYVHNRVEDIDHAAAVIARQVPAARVVSVHGQMSGPALEKRMLDFIEQTYNVLVSTTIIENGIDIPLVNTLIVARADLFGLAQLYQLRGRVGRSARQAYAYLFVPPFSQLTGPARLRLKALKEFSELGSGFRLAAKDLEIRGAGNLLGFEQHGNMAAVGFDYFMHLLDQAIMEMKGQSVEEVKCEINLKVDIRIPEDYVPQVNLRLNLYKRISSLDNPEEAGVIEQEVRDRFGPPPPGVLKLLRYGAIKHLAQKLRVRSLDRVGSKLVVKLHASTSADLSRLAGLLRKRAGSITPQGVLTIPLKPDGEEAILGETLAVMKEL
ncbi:MAG: transcription-repair coupling factor [Candidatus Aminicenantes bacterium]|nr:transcription-repair coupling factor [Candidatus Aminicenantes bacterium]